MALGKLCQGATTKRQEKRSLSLQHPLFSDNETPGNVGTSSSATRKLKVKLEGQLLKLGREFCGPCSCLPPSFSGSMAS